MVFVLLKNTSSQQKTAAPGMMSVPPLVSGAQGEGGIPDRFVVRRGVQPLSRCAGFHCGGTRDRQARDRCKS